MGHRSQKRLSYLLPFLRERDDLLFECIGNKVMQIKCIGERNLSILAFSDRSADRSAAIS